MKPNIQSQAEVIVTLLNDAVVPEVLPVAAGAVRGFVTLKELKNLGETLLVRVYPASLVEAGEGTRGGPWEDIAYTIFIAKRIDPATPSEVDGLIDFELSARELLEDAGEVGGLDIEEISIGGGTGEFYDPELLIGSHIFVARIDLTLSNK